MRQAAVIVKLDAQDEKRLTGYLVAAEGEGIEANAVRQYLAKKLPEYMVPAAIVLLDQLPLTPNGKLDRNKLPDPELPARSGLRLLSSFEEKILCELFGQVLVLEEVGVNDNFFEMGGHSLLAMRLASRIRERLGYEVPIAAVFECPTIALLAERLPTFKQTRPELKAYARPQNIPLSYGQRRLWFLYRLEGPSATYNIPIVLRFSGTLNYHSLRQALLDVMERHESLRTVFREKGFRISAYLALGPSNCCSGGKRSLSQS